MKIKLLLIFLIIHMNVWSRTFFVKNSGSDAANGLTPSTAWQNLSRVNAATFLANDSIAFERGSTFFGSLIVNRNDLTFLSFGTGEKPIITGKVDLTSWSHLGGNIWRANLPSVDSTLSLFTINSVITPFARQNWTRYTAVSASSITVPHTGSWLGKTIGLKFNDWRLGRTVVTQDLGNGTIVFRKWFDIGNGTSANLEPTKNNFGCAIINELSLLDSQNDLFFDYPNQFLYIYSNGMPTNVSIPNVDTLMNIGQRQNITVKNIDFRYGGLFGIFAVQTPNIMVDSCSFTYIGANGFNCYRLSNSTIQNSYFAKCLQMGIYVRSVTSPYDNINILNNITDSIGMWYFMGSFGNDGEYSAIYATANTGLNVKFNKMFNTGDIPIKWNGSDVVIGYNFGVNYNLLLADRGMTYTFGGGGTNRRQVRNLAYNGWGDTTGTPNGGSSNPIFRSNCYYVDGVPNNNVTIDSCYGYNYPRSGANGNISNNFVVTNCIFIPGDSLTRYRNARGIGMQEQGSQPLRGTNIQNNTIFLSSTTQKQIYYTVASIGQAQMVASYKAIGTINNNYYNIPTTANYGTEWNVPAGNLQYTHANWVSTFNFGLQDIQLPPYTLSQCKFLYNYYDNTNSVRSIPGTWITPNGTIYTNTITIPPYTAVFLMPTTASPIVITVDSNPVITLPVSSTTISVTATGGTITTYAWTQTSGATATIVSPTTRSTSITGLSTAGVRIFKVVVTNSGGQKDSTLVTVVVNPAPPPANLPPVVSISPNPVEITLPTNSVSLVGTATDPNGDLMTYVWTKTSGGNATITTPTALNTTITGLEQGVYIFTLTAIDTGGAIGSNTVQITVNPAPPTPTVNRARVKRG